MTLYFDQSGSAALSGTPLGITLVFTHSVSGAARTEHDWQLVIYVRRAGDRRAVPGSIAGLLTPGVIAIDGVYSAAATGIVTTPIDFSSYLTDFTLTEGDDGFVSSLEFSLENPATDPDAWYEVVLTIDPGTADEEDVFGGYITKATPEYRQNGYSLRWRCEAEGYETLINRTELIRKTYVSQTVKAIVGDLFSLAGLTTFDAATHVTTGPTLTVFSTEGELLGSVLSRLTEIAGQQMAATWVWKVDAAKAVWLGPASADAAPFDVVEGAGDFSATFPAAAGTVKIESDASDIRNQVTVRGGVGPSPVQTETFTGDGATTTFQLRQKPVRQINSITLAGVRQNHGTDWYDTFGAGYDCLVNYRAGTVRFSEAGPPAAAASLVVSYRYDLPVLATVQDQDSFDTYGLWFKYEIEDRSITSQDDAEDLANAILNQYAEPVVAGSLTTRRWGLRAGQQVTATFGTIGLSGAYAVRKMTYRRDASEHIGECTVQFGGRPTRFSQAFGGGSSAISSGYGATTTPRASGEVQDWYVRGDLYVGWGDDVFRLSSTNNVYVAWAGAADASSAPWRVTVDGEMTATNINVTGGDLAGFTISPNAISYGDFRIQQGYLYFSDTGYFVLDGVTGWVSCSEGMLIGESLFVYDGIECVTGLAISRDEPLGDRYIQLNAGATSYITLKLWLKDELELDGALNHDGTTVGFYGAAPAAKPTVTGSRGGNAALASLLTGLATLGLVTDSSSA